MLDPHILLLIKTNLKQLRLPAICAEFEKLAREAAGSNESYEQFLLRLTELVETQLVTALDLLGIEAPEKM